MSHPSSHRARHHDVYAHPGAGRREPRPADAREMAAAFAHEHEPREHRVARTERREERSTGDTPARQMGEARRRAPARPEAARRTAGAPYTLGHAGRQIRFGPVAFWTIVGTLVIMAAWSLVTATYFAFHDDVIKRVLARQADMQYAYEDRIADLRARIDRMTSRQLLDQEQFEQKLDQLLRRQAVLESRASALSGIADPATTGSIRTPPRGTAKSAPAAAPALPGRQSQLELRGVQSTAPDERADLDGVLARVQDALDRIEVRQSASLNALEESYDARARRMRGVLADLGLEDGKAASHAGVGGPFVPVKLPVGASAFDRQVYRVNFARAQVDRLNRVLGTVPIRKPVSGEIDTTSGFGVRIDPFLGRPAMHTGIDFRGDVGEPIEATASGTVTQAGWSGGYGKMVEISHGNGLSTRYGHLSEIDVGVGQHVKSGQVIGRLGSTGRSTGPHLHYETRVEGEAVDPQKFLRAGFRLGSGT